MNTTAKKRSSTILALLLGLISVAFFTYFIYQQFTTQYATQLGRFEQDQAAFAKLGGDFRMQTTNGETNLSAIWVNKIILLYYGFTRCPDICPTSLATMQAALKQLPPQERKQLQVVFISADPEYDTPERLQNYLEFFIDDAIGMTAGLEHTQAVARKYGAYFNKIKLPDSALGYTVDHSTRWYLIQKNGKIGTVFDHNLAPSEMAEVLGIFARYAD